MKAATFSVIITNYNYRDYVGEAIDSVLAQTRAVAQVIVMDDGSTDGSAAWLAEHYGNDERVTLRCVSNGGQLSAFVRGMDGVTGDIVCFLDADDRWDKDYVAPSASSTTVVATSISCSPTSTCSATNRALSVTRITPWTLATPPSAHG